MRGQYIVLGGLLAGFSRVSALSPAQWRSQSIYQIVTDRFSLPTGSSSPSCTGSQLYEFCNGTFQGIIHQLDYIQGMGFTALWISPIVKNIAGGSPDGYTADGAPYHGYWAQDIYQINPHFGTPSDLQALSQALHSRNMYLMVDVVVNHMGYYCGASQAGNCGPEGTINYSVYNPFNSESYFHPFCEINYNNATSILDCWEGGTTVPLPDLRTEDSNVQGMYNTWIQGLVQNYSIDGLRIDSLQQSGSFFFPSFYQASGGIYAVGEVLQGNPSTVCPYQQNGMPGVLNYPTYYSIVSAFESSTGSMSNLAQTIDFMQGNCSDTTLLGSFLENHDNARFPSHTSDMALAMNAIAFTILQDGIPIVYYGQEQHLSGGSVPNNRESLWSSGGYNTQSTLYEFIAKVNGVRKQAISKSSSYVTSKLQIPLTDANTIVTRKGPAGSQIVGVYTNLGANGACSTLSLSSSQTGFTAGQQIIEVLTCTLLTTSSTGALSVEMASGQPRILIPYSAVSGSSICQTTSSTFPGSSCSTVSVTFDILVDTAYGETVVVAGNIPSLGNWNVPSALKLSASQYTTSNPLWQGTATGISPQEVFQWKPVVIETNGSYLYSPGSNLQATAPALSRPTETLTYTFVR